MMFPYMYEAQFLVEDGATPEQVDRALTDFGMAMGIFAVDDMGGLDVLFRVQQELGHFSDPAVRKPLVHTRLFPSVDRPEPAVHEHQLGVIGNFECAAMFTGQAKLELGATEYEELAPLAPISVGAGYVLSLAFSVLGGKVEPL